MDTADLLDRVRSYGVRGVQGAAVVDPMSPDALADWLGAAPAPDPAGDLAHGAQQQPQPQPIG